MKMFYDLKDNGIRKKGGLLAHASPLETSPQRKGGMYVKDG
jgi:hypothetical protein